VGVVELQCREMQQTIALRAAIEQVPIRTAAKVKLLRAACNNREK
jgi:hypothetical protein